MTKWSGDLFRFYCRSISKNQCTLDQLGFNTSSAKTVTKMKTSQLNEIFNVLAYKIKNLKLSKVALEFDHEVEIESNNSIK